MNDDEVDVKKGIRISLRTSELMDITGSWPVLVQAVCDKANALQWDAAKTPVDEVMDRFEPYFVLIDAKIAGRLPNTFNMDAAREVIQKAITEAFLEPFPPR